MYVTVVLSLNGCTDIGFEPREYYGLRTCRAVHDDDLGSGGQILSVKFGFAREHIMLALPGGF